VRRNVRDPKHPRHKEATHLRFKMTAQAWAILEVAGVNDLVEADYLAYRLRVDNEQLVTRLFESYTALHNVCDSLHRVHVL
jgi:hypothetical protein